MEIQNFQFELQNELQRLSTIYKRFSNNQVLTESLFFELFKYLLINSKIFINIIKMRISPMHIVLRKFTLQEIHIIIYIHLIICNNIVLFISRKSKTDVYTKDGICVSNIKLYLYNLYKKCSNEHDCILNCILHNKDYYEWLNCNYTFCLFDDNKNGNIIFEINVEKLFTPFEYEEFIENKNLIIIKWITFVKNLQMENTLH
jgi:hypothetical protein